jgi:hypothetical protein
MYDAIAALLAILLAGAFGTGPCDAPPAEPVPGITAGSGDTKPAEIKPTETKPPATKPVPANPTDSIPVASNKPDSRSMAVVCEVKFEGPSNRPTIVALATSAEPRLGTYALEIEKTGANTARTRQRGEFDLAAGETKRLAVARMGVGAGERLTGQLSLKWDGGESACPIK